MSDSNLLLMSAHEAMQRAGVDSAEVYRRLGIHPPDLMQTDRRWDHRHSAVFWRAVEEVTGDPEIGLHLCPYLSPFAGEVPTLLLISSPTLGSGIERMLRYLRLLSDLLNLRLDTSLPGADAVITGAIGNETTLRHHEIAASYVLTQALRHASGGLFVPRRIELHCPPRASPAEFEKTFGCPVGFGAAQTRIYFPRGLLDLPLPHAHPDVLQAQEALVRRQMGKVLKHERVREVRRLIASQLEGQRCSLKSVAAQLRRTPRSLGKELGEAGTTFNQLLLGVRQSLAKRLLAHSTEPVEHIARRTGFSERSAFFRAFKSWTGLTPLQYRKSRQGQQASLP